MSLLAWGMVMAPLRPVAAFEPAAAEDLPDVPTGPAPASNATAAVLPLEIDGEISEADVGRLTDELVAGLQRGAFTVLPPSEVSAATDDAVACDEAACYEQVASTLGATHVVRATVAVHDRDYAVEVRLIDGSNGKMVVSGQESCEICGIVDAGNLMDSAAATLRTKLDALAKGPSTIQIRSHPEGAVVSIDGEVVGTTPLQRPVVPGERVVRVSKEGYIGIEREVTLVQGARENLSFELDALPNRLPKRPWGWASLSVGLLTLGGGIALVALHDLPYEVGDNCQGANRDAEGDCRWLWGTKWYGAGAAIAGAALTTLGIAILINTSKRDREQTGETKESARVGIGPGNISISGRF